MEELQVMQSQYDAIRAKGGEIIAVSADNSELAKSTVEKHGLKFPIVADSDLKLIKQFGLMHEGGRMGEDWVRPAVLFIRADGSVSSAIYRENYRYTVKAEELMTGFNQSVTAK